MAHLPDLSALALDRAPLVPTGAPKRGKGSKGGASKKQKTDDAPNAPATPRTKRRREEEAAKREEQAKKARDEREAFKTDLDNRIAELLRTKKIKKPKRGGWVPTERDDDGNFVDPNPDQSCCTTGAPPAEIEDPEAWAIAQKKQAEAELQRRMDMSPEEWTKACGSKREAQIERIKKTTRAYKRYRHYVSLRDREESKRTTEHPLTPNYKDRRYSNRGWAGAVRQWTRLLDAAWNDQRGEPESEETHELDPEC